MKKTKLNKTPHPITLHQINPSKMQTCTLTIPCATILLFCYQEKEAASTWPGLKVFSLTWNHLTFCLDTRPLSNLLVNTGIKDSNKLFSRVSHRRLVLFVYTENSHEHHIHMEFSSLVKSSFQCTELHWNSTCSLISRFKGNTNKQDW